VGQRCVATNLPWAIDARTLSRKLRIAHVTLINDLAALAMGSLTVPTSHLRLLAGQALPKRKGGTLAVLAAGTGLGEAVLVWEGARSKRPGKGHFIVMATEGGHVDFAPRDELEVELLEFLRRRIGHVSYERVLSGPGLGNVYDFFRQSKGIAESQENVELLATARDRNATIADLGLSRKSEAAAHALELFASVYGAEAGNLALKSFATGGVLLAGNIAVKVLDVLLSGPFARSFHDKGRMAPLLEQMPVAVVLDTDLGLAGAARYLLETSD
jgi:glucokinase